MKIMLFKGENTMYQILILLVGVLLSANGFAHVGHDHNHIMSGVIHWFWVIALLMPVILYLFFSKKDEKLKRIVKMENKDVV